LSRRGVIDDPPVSVPNSVVDQGRKPPATDARPAGDGPKQPATVAETSAATLSSKEAVTDVPRAGETPSRE
jgi:hypothetical protein